MSGLTLDDPLPLAKACQDWPISGEDRPLFWSQAYVKFWYEFSDIGWNRITRIVSASHDLDLAQSARLFALVNIALADSYIAGWDSKFYYDARSPPFGPGTLMETQRPKRILPGSL